MLVSFIATVKSDQNKSVELGIGLSNWDVKGVKGHQWAESHSLLGHLLEGLHVWIRVWALSIDGNAEGSHDDFLADFVSS